MPDDPKTPDETPPPGARTSEPAASEPAAESRSSESLSSEPAPESLSSDAAIDPKETGRDRLWGALTAKPSRAQVVVGVLLAAVGFAAMTQVRSNEEDDQYGALRQSDLIRVLDGLAATAQQAETEIDRLRSTRDDLQTSTSSRQAALDQARKESNTLSILAGTVPTVGPGVRITITDDRGEIQDETLIDIIQELRAAGAEAMEFNDRIRVVAQTSVEETSRGIEVDGQVIDAPYVIDAIGEPTTLAGSLDFATGPVDRVRDEGGTISFDERDEIEIESVVPDQAPRYAEPDDGQ
jgi:uncharacterized protein YlxW (UPF0749 family)